MMNVMKSHLATKNENPATPDNPSRAAIMVDAMNGTISSSIIPIDPRCAS